MKAILLFLDGVGIGKNNPEINPFFQAHLPTFRSLFHQELPHLKSKSISSRLAELVPLNATLGVAGLPQSGTGQSAIFTGVNAAKLIGKHFGPYPPTAVRPTVESQNIFRQLKSLGKTVVFANAFPKQFFDYTNSGTRRLTVTTLSCMLSGVPLLNIEALRRNAAISADLTRARWPELGFPEIPTVSAREAGTHLAELASKHDFALFEYWLTDHAGHAQNMAVAVEVLQRFDEFLDGFLSRMNLSSTLVVVVSDHGNVEDLSVKSHTRNPVPCIVMGYGRKNISARLRNLTHITPTLVDFLQE